LFKETKIALPREKDSNYRRLFYYTIPKVSMVRRGRPARTPPKNKPGVYRITNKKTDKVEYIGESNNLARRKREHRQTGNLNPKKERFEHQASPNATTDQRRAQERAQIKRHNPPRNQRRGGGGRRASE
jgi:predicted GIY-YIG superfamily endonuclease